MKKINDGGPAFPGFTGNGDGTININGTEVPLLATHGGMSLRDWLAGHALAGMLAHSTRYRPRPGAPSNWHAAIAQESYEMADAMLAARERQP